MRRAMSYQTKRPLYKSMWLIAFYAWYLLYVFKSIRGCSCVLLCIFVYVYMRILLNATITWAMRIFSLLISDGFLRFLRSFLLQIFGLENVCNSQSFYPFIFPHTHTRTPILLLPSFFILPICHHFHWNKFHYLLSWSIVTNEFFWFKQFQK